jgi:hypothetical protein
MCAGATDTYSEILRREDSVIADSMVDAGGAGRQHIQQG